MHSDNSMQMTAIDTTDGRRMRSERTREAIIASCTRLITDNGQPNADQIAAAALVGKRTVFQHFSSLDELFHACGYERVTEFRLLAASAA